jgi:hypothetical protein
MTLVSGRQVGTTMRRMVALAIGALMLAACSDARAPADADADLRSEPPPLTLYVSNQSFAEPEVGITVTIDGEVVVDDRFPVRDQHHVVPFAVDIGPGDHTLTATSDAGVEHTVTLTIPERAPRWVALLYWWSPEDGPPTFTVDISDEPISFG